MKKITLPKLESKNEISIKEYIDLVKARMLEKLNK